jgi:acyl transferase domain-containing protein
MEHRFAAVAVNASELVTQLRRSASPTQQSVQSARDVVFLFPGQGQQFLGMAAGLYREDPSFRQIIDSGAQLLRDEFRLDVLGMLTGTEPVGKDKDSLTETSFAQPLLFLLEYALAARWRALGVEPRALLGHSLGELTAAAVAGVFTFEDGLRLAAERGRMMSETPAGLMLAVGLPSEALTRYFGADLWLAAENGPKLSVASGLPAAIENLEKQLAKDRIATVRLASRNAFHSPLMSDAAKTFRNRVAAVARREPSIPWLSNVSGTWIEAAEAQNPQYWGNQILSRVRFAKCVAALAEHPRILLEVGPGEALARMASQQLPGSIAIPSLGAENRRSPDDLVFLDSCARLWQAGIDLVWRELQGNEKVRRISLPTYPFERERYWIEPANKAAAQKPVAGNSSSQAAATATDEKRQDISSWFYMPGWQSAPPLKANLGNENSFYGTEWLVLSDASSFADQLVAGLETAGASAARVATAPGLNMLGRYYPNLICLDTMAGSRDSGESFNNLLTLFQSALAAGHRFTQMVLITDRLEQVLEEPIRHVGSSEVQSLFRVMPLEFPGARCRVIDVDTSSGNPVDKILAELRSPVGEPAIVLRGTSRWQKRWIPVSLDKPSTTAFRKGGAYLITGGIGGMGLAIASHLLQRYEARVVLTSRSALPPRQDWGAILESGSVDDEIARRIRRMQEMERYGGRIEFIAADAADREAMSAVIAQMRESYGRIDGVIHAAGVSGGRMIAALDPAEAAEVRRPKVLASRILAELLRGSDLDFLLFCSSISAITPAPGQAAYAAANAFQSYFARYCRQEYGLPAVAIDFDAWQDVGMMAALVLPDGFEDLKAARMRTAMTADEGIEVIERVLGGWPGAEILTSTTALKFVPDQAAPRHSNEQPQRSSTAETTPEVEMILKIWSDLLADHDIGPQDNFFELGGHSLLGTMVLSRIRERTGVQLTLRTLFEAPTPEALAAQIRQSRDSETVPASDAEEREEFEI